MMSCFTMQRLWFSHNMGQIPIQAWSLRRSGLFTLTRQASPLNCTPGAKRSMLSLTACNFCCISFENILELELIGMLLLVSNRITDILSSWMFKHLCNFMDPRKAFIKIEISTCIVRRQRVCMTTERQGAQTSQTQPRMEFTHRV